MKNIIKILNLTFYLFIILTLYTQFNENREFLIKLYSVSNSLFYFFIYQFFFISLIATRAYFFFNYFYKIKNIYKWIEVYFLSILSGIIVPYSSSAYRIISLKFFGYPIYITTTIFLLLFLFVLSINIFFFLLISLSFDNLYLFGLIFIFNILIFLGILNIHTLLKLINSNFYQKSWIKKLYNVFKNIYNFLKKKNINYNKKFIFFFIILSLLIFLMEFFSLYSIVKILSNVDSNYLVYIDKNLLIKIFFISFFLDRIPFFNIIPGISELVFASVLTFFLDLQFTYSFFVKLTANLSIMFASLLLISLFKIFLLFGKISK
jgi:hypothetical protein